MAQRETENNASAKFWGDKERALWFVMVFSGVVNSKVALVVCDYCDKRKEDAVCTLKPGFHMIVRIFRIVPVVLVCYTAVFA